jgi:hypothetical protein
MKEAIDGAGAEIRAMTLRHSRAGTPSWTRNTELPTRAEYPVHPETREVEVTLLLHPPQPAVVVFAAAVDAKDLLLEQGTPLDAAAAVALELGTSFTGDIFREDIQFTKCNPIQ